MSETHDQANPLGDETVRQEEAASASETALPTSASEPDYDIVIQDFSHWYDGYRAVDKISVAIPRGTITGFIGPNGAGKTTTIQLLATLLNPSEGDASICGFSCTRRRAEVRRRMGYMPDSFGVYEGLSAREYLQFFAEAHKLPLENRTRLIREIVDLLNLGDKLETPVDGLSRGQLQRLSLARTLLHDPQVLILDEPAAGLDPLARTELLYVMRELRSLGKTLLISSHILTEVAQVCDQLMIMAGGRLVAYGSMDEICRSVRPHFSIELHVLEESGERAAEILRRSGVEDVRVIDQLVEFDYVGEQHGLVNLHRRLVNEGIPLLYFKPMEVTLEQAFAELTRLIDQGAAHFSLFERNPKEGSPGDEPNAPMNASEDAEREIRAEAGNTPPVE